jgi:fatty acid desaturase
MRRRENNLSQGARMLWTIAIILLILWLLGAFVVNVGSIVHLLLVIAVVVIVYRLVTGRRPVV